jgi:hypothetical protein
VERPILQPGPDLASRAIGSTETSDSENEFVTEARWLTCDDPQPMLEFLRGKASDRKLRLFALACFRPYRFMLVPETLQARDVAERLAEGTVSPAERKRARSSVPCPLESRFRVAASPGSSQGLRGLIPGPKCL